MKATVLAAGAAVLGLAATATAATTVDPALSPEPSSYAVTGDVRVAAVGDMVCDPDSSSYATCRHEDTANLVAAEGSDVVIPLGDTQYERGDAGDYTDAYDKSWGRFLSYTYPVIGNHEYLTAGAAGYFDYFSDRTTTPGWYAFNVGEWRFYALNTECSKVDCAAEKAWMAADAKANPATCQAMLMHRPRYSSGKHGSSNIPKRFWALAYNKHFELALASHDHSYERFDKMDYAGNVTSNGIRSFVVGTGGKSLYPFGPTAPGSQVRYNANYGVLFLDVRPGSYDWRYITIDGQTVDTGTDTCA